jgi:putative pyruvate formate lyase activating enzyme
MSGDLSECRLCPRRCGVDRSQGRIGVCAVPEMVYVARAALHFWEEPCISGENGSGTVFFSGCPLRCVYCQNFELARAKRGKPVTVEALSRLFLKLQEEGANNINLVTPTQYTWRLSPRSGWQRMRGFICRLYTTVADMRALKRSAFWRVRSIFT